MSMRKGPPANRRTLREVISKAIVIAYREDVTKLVSSLTTEGFKVDVLRAEYTSEEMSYSKNSKTFISHRKAWEKATKTADYTLICEADFVPCRGIADFDVFWPLENKYAWGYLYQGSPRLLAVVGPERYLRGQAAPLVAYVINATVASLMLKYFEIEKETHDLRSYFTFRFSPAVACHASRRGSVHTAFSLWRAWWHAEFRTCQPRLARPRRAPPGR